LRLVSVVLVATLMVVAGCSMLMPAVMADYHGDFKSTEDTGVTSNLGKINFKDCTVPVPGDYSLPQIGLGVGIPGGPYTATITYLPASGYRFVKWGTSGGASVANPLSQTTVLTLTEGGYTVTAVYQKGRIFSRWNRPACKHIHCTCALPSHDRPCRDRRRSRQETQKLEICNLLRFATVK